MAVGLLATMLSTACASRADVPSASEAMARPALNCQFMAFVAPDHDAILRSGPATQTDPIARLQPFQYLCVVAIDELDWKLVKAVPLPGGQDRMACAPTAGADCLPIGSHPVQWVGAPDSGQGHACQTVARPGDEMLTIQVLGACPTGWLPGAGMRPLAD